MDVVPTGTEVGNRGRRWVPWIAGVVVLTVAAAAVTWFVVGGQDSRSGAGGAGVSSTPTGTSSTVTSSDGAAEAKMLAEVDAILKARASAVVAGRLPQYLEHVDPSSRKLLQRDRQVFANLRRIGIRQLSYQRELNYSPEAQAKHGADAWAVRIMMMVQIAGIDSVPRASPLGYTFARRGGRWLLVADDDLAAEPDRGTYREPWDLGTIEAVRGPGVLVIVPAGEGGNGRRLAREAQAAVRVVRSATRRAQAGILVVALADRRSFDPGWRTGGHPAGAVAVPNYVPTNPELTDFKVAGSRVVINPDERRDEGRLLLAHEFTHAAMSPLGNAAPTWLVEGFAMYVEYRLAEQSGYRQGVAERRRELRREGLPAMTVLPIDGVFHGEYDEDSYGISWLIVEYLASKYGLTTVNALYADLAKGPDDPGIREQVIQKHLKISETALVAAIKKYHGPA